MRIVCDSNILPANSSLATVADLHLIPGREICREDLLHADALLVRSITRVDAALLEGTSVRFVGTATSGTDHIDLDFLQQENIRFADARGSNANAVVDYCFAALAFAVLQRNLRLDRCVVGLVGAGHVGGLFAQRLDRLGIQYRVCDPPLQKLIGTDSLSSPVCAAAFETETQHQGHPVPPVSRFCILEEILCCDVVSLHVPLVMSGPYATFKLMGERELRQLRQDATLINTCRGSVVHEPALVEKLRNGMTMTCIMDVWDNEPLVAAELVQLADIATPHIAGYSQDAKQAATRMLLVALSGYFGLALPDSVLPALADQIPAAPLKGGPDAHWTYLQDLLPVAQLSADFKHSVHQGNTEIQFDAMRKRLLSRRELRNFQCPGASLSPEQKHFLQVMGIALS